MNSNRIGINLKFKGWKSKTQLEAVGKRIDTIIQSRPKIIPTKKECK